MSETTSTARKAERPQKRSSTGPGLPAVQREARLREKYAGRPPVAEEAWACLEAAHELVERFRAAYHREPTPAEIEIYRTLMYEKQRSLGVRPVAAQRNGGR